MPHVVVVVVVASDGGTYCDGYCLSMDDSRYRYLVLDAFVDCDDNNDVS